MTFNNMHHPFRTALLALPLALGMGGVLSGCQDDHFDVKTDELGGNSTIWQNIQSRSELSQFADILQNVYYSQTEEKTTSETYADLFNGDQTFTVWAPLNGQFDYAYYKNLLNTGIRDSIYKVELQLIRNNMTRYSRVLNGSDSVLIDLFNSKHAWLNYDKQTLKGMRISTPNVGASNGVLHLIDGAVPYQPNLYEFMATRPELDSLNAFIKSWQKTEFNESASTQGPTVNGQVTWVDSITYLSNSYLKSFLNADLTAEDSSYVMAMPTNTAWDAVIEKTKKYFRYRTLPYKQSVYTKNEKDEDTIVVTDITLEADEIDSLMNLYSHNAICQNLVFNARWQYERVPITSLQDLGAVDSLKSTAGMKFKKTGTLNGTNKTGVVEVDNFAGLFGNTDPIEVSNGYAYITNTFNFPTQLFAPNMDRASKECYEHCTNVTNNNQPSELTVVYDNISIGDQIDDAGYRYLLRDGDTIRTGLSLPGTAGRYTIQYDVDGNIKAYRDSLYQYTYQAFTHQGTTSPTAFFKLNGIRSCKYDIGVVVGFNISDYKPYKIQAFMNYDTEDTYSTRPRQRLTNPEDGSNYFVNKAPTVNDKMEINFTDTLWVARDFEFPVCYVGGDLNGNAYPVLELYNYVTNSEARTTYTRDMWINAIILKSKEW